MLELLGSLDIDFNGKILNVRFININSKKLI